MSSGTQRDLGLAKWWEGWWKGKSDADVKAMEVYADLVRAHLPHLREEASRKARQVYADAGIDLWGCPVPPEDLFR